MSIMFTAVNCYVCGKSSEDCDAVYLIAGTAYCEKHGEEKRAHVLDVISSAAKNNIRRNGMPKGIGYGKGKLKKGTKRGTIKKQGKTNKRRTQ